MTRTEREALGALQKQYGIQRSYRAAAGEMIRADVDAVLAVLTALGVDTNHAIPEIARREAERAESRVIEPVVLAWNGRLNDVIAQVSAAARRARVSWAIELEDGSVIDESSLQLLPPGYHQLHVQTTTGQASALVISAPRRCHEGERARQWGVFAPLYALRESRDQAIGDFHDLATVMQWTATLRGDVVATLPISAAFLRTPYDPSPYAPASRLFWNEIYLHIEGAPDAVWTRAAESPFVDYRATAEVKRAILDAQAVRFFAENGTLSEAFQDFLQLYPNADDYATFRAAGEFFHSGWSAWPATARAGQLTPADYSDAARQYHLYAQFLAQVQLSRLAAEARQSGVRLYLDLPLGVHAESYDIWRNRDLFVMGLAAGAPPDPFFNKGQDWGFPPLHPVQAREHQYRYWRNVLQTQLRYAGTMRLDHVMGLHRLYVIPHGYDATRGVYVRYPAEELYAVLALESARHQAVIVGEDLGTVPAEIRKSMNAHGVKRMFVVQFEATDNAARPLSDVPAGAVASLNTHDMPPFRAYWEGRDADLRRALDLIDEAGVAEAHATRARTADAISRMLGASRTLAVDEARDALLEHLARSPAALLLVNLEDLWLESEPQNVPGTSEERPNWRRRLRYTLQELRSNQTVRTVLSNIEKAMSSESKLHPTNQPQTQA